MLRRAPKIIDATLREGQQAPGVHFDVRQSVEIAKMLEQLGVDIVECGHPSAPGEAERARAVAKAIQTPVLAHARATIGDVDAVADVGAEWVGIFCGVNPISLRTRLGGRTLDEVRALIVGSVAHARKRGLRVRFTVEDASRTPMDTLLETYELAIRAGAHRICYSDTVGAMTPAAMRDGVAALRAAFPNVDIEVHCHDDRGLALANTLAALEAGATWVSTTVNGIGERAGITDLCLLMANLQHDSLRRICRPAALQRISRVVAAYSRMPVDRHRPVVGENAFTHSAALHLRAVKKDEMAYSWTPPSAVGRATKVAGKPITAETELVKEPMVIPATELRYHRKGHGTRFVMIDDRLVDDCRQYCIVRHVPHVDTPPASHVDSHRHQVDSLFLFLGTREDLTGLKVEVSLEGKVQQVESPASVFIPAGVEHSYRILEGSGLFVNHVLKGNYNESLLDAHESGEHYLGDLVEPKRAAS
jgi:2-isopropylmalate synthase